MSNLAEIQVGLRVQQARIMRLTVCAVLTFIFAAQVFPSGQAISDLGPRKLKDVQPVYPADSLRTGDEGT